MVVGVLVISNGVFFCCLQFVFGRGGKGCFCFVGQVFLICNYHQ